jgi:uncharacterized protein (TIGR02757 family)
VNPADRRLSDVLERLYRQYNRTASAVDPIHLVRRYSQPADQEVAGFCAAGLAFGRVASVIDTVERLLARMSPSPAAYVRQFEPAREVRALAALGHRWIRARDLSALLLVLRGMLHSSGSIERFFLEGHDPESADVGAAIDSFSERALAIDLRPAYGRVPARPGVRSFFPRPFDGSACKRLNLFLRWMVRHDTLDLGAWTGVSPAQLIIPLDTHVIRVGRALGLTGRRSPGWPMAAEITAALRRFDPADPVRFDFSLCHIGMEKGCGFDGTCDDAACPLHGFCRSEARTARAGRAARTRQPSPRPSARR